MCPLFQPSSSILNAKSQRKRMKNRMRKRRAAKKLEHPGDLWLPQPWHSPRDACGGHHTLDVVVSAQPALPLPECVVLCFSLDRDLCLRSIVLGLLSCFCEHS